MIEKHKKKDFVNKFEQVFPQYNWPRPQIILKYQKTKKNKSEKIFYQKKSSTNAALGKHE